MKRKPRSKEAKKNGEFQGKRSRLPKMIMQQKSKNPGGKFKNIAIQDLEENFENLESQSKILGQKQTKLEEFI